MFETAHPFYTHSLDRVSHLNQTQNTLFYLSAQKTSCKCHSSCSIHARKCRDHLLRRKTHFMLGCAFKWLACNPREQSLPSWGSKYEGNSCKYGIQRRCNGRRTDTPRAGRHPWRLSIHHLKALRRQTAHCSHSWLDADNLR